MDTALLPRRGQGTVALAQQQQHQQQQQQQQQRRRKEPGQHV
jgi:hypothetical protein|tara:strand:- start:1033 stop:1158 length:126 start_codon:yes stop_codon:yes gene_type:complete